ncbi:MAG: YIP1 family protein [Pseudomonadota bacterium]
MSEAIRNTSMLGAAARFFVSPRASVRAVLDSRPSEGRILALGMFAGLVLFARQMADILSQPELLQDQTELVMQSLVSFLFFVPLAYYGVAALGTAIARLFGGTGKWYEGRVAFFWAAFISAPVMLLTGILPLVVPGLPAPFLILVGQIGVFFFAWAIAQAFAEAFSFTRTWLVLIVVCSPAIVTFVYYLVATL